MVPRFPLYGGKISCGAKDCGKDTAKCKRSCGMNFNLVEEILAGVQDRVCLYLMTPSTGEFFLNNVYGIHNSHDDDTVSIFRRPLNGY
ncbi:MAG: hypothetical protein GY816_20645 [Cytophagales bacterium]|nr:hypothetical protein [Cytophagales bacterium]